MLKINKIKTKVKFGYPAKIQYYNSFFIIYKIIIYSCQLGFVLNSKLLTIKGNFTCSIVF